ncbi:MULTISPECIES: hypothetical protein [Stenotrophomonas]|uniref:hypothetical protein n=1 Tax=Stenotrophomonas TaxID=40323 RepID=UPI000B6DF56C|nr:MULTISPECIES: hypothetical protein [Stenotrophomonas]SMR82944.1 hypothetical protein SAMN04487863_3668 [Stenotrophomonas sp. yr243]SNT48199.1 hypothetical protein SAMN05518671_2285 [Stenotrophomonas lactitubi]
MRKLDRSDYFLLAVLTMVVSIVSFPWAGRQYPDTMDYLSQAARSWADAGIYSGARASGYVIYLKLFGAECQGLYIQWILYPVAWGALAWSGMTLIHEERSRVLLVAFCVVAGMSAQYSQWAASLLTESIAGSLFILLSALCLRMLKDGRTLYWVVFVAISVAYALARDVNAYQIMFLVPALLLLRGKGVVRFIAVLVIAGACLFVVNSAERNERWLFPYMNVLGQDVLPNYAMRAKLEERELPHELALRHSGKWASSDDLWVMNAGEAEPLRAWARSHGKKEYAKLVVADAPYATLKFLRQLPALVNFSGDELAYYGGASLAGKHQRLFAYSLWPVIAMIMFASGMLLVGASGISDSGGVRGYLFSVWLALSGFLVIGISYFADAMERLRHALPGGLAWTVAAIMLFCLVASGCRRAEVSAN